MNALIKQGRQPSFYSTLYIIPLVLTYLPLVMYLSHTSLASSRHLSLVMGTVMKKRRNLAIHGASVAGFGFSGFWCLRVSNISPKNFWAASTGGPSHESLQVILRFSIGKLSSLRISFRNLYS